MGSAIDVIKLHPSSQVGPDTCLVFVPLIHGYDTFFLQESPRYV